MSFSILGHLTVAHHTRSLVLAVSLLGAVACGRRSPDKDSSPRTTPSANPGALAITPPSAPASSSAPPLNLADAPTLSAERFAPDKTRPSAMFALDNAIVIVDRARLGRVQGDSVEWLPKPIANDGEHIVTSLSGHWPDSIDEIETNGSRAPMPAYVAVTGQGDPDRFGAAGFYSHDSVLKVGKRTFFTGFDAIRGVVFSRVRGPASTYRFQPFSKFTCVADWKTEFTGAHGATFNPAAIQPHSAPPLDPDAAFLPAVVPSVFAATRGGVLMNIGRLCDGRAMAEVWDDDTKPSRLVELGDKVKFESVYSSWFTAQGPGEELWVTPQRSQVTWLLHYKDGEFSKGPESPVKIEFLFASREGTPYVSDGKAIFRLNRDRWEPVARLNWPSPILNMAIEGDTFWVTSGRTEREGEYNSISLIDTSVYRLRPAPSTEYTDGCTTPFVYLYEVSPKNDRKFTFPGTRKALATFADVAKLGLVEVNEGGYRLGLTVPDRATADDVIAHLATTMKDEHPKLMCYAPRSPRSVPLTK